MKTVMDHIVLNVEDTRRMVAFYQELLEFTPERLEEFRQGKVPFPSARVNPDTVIDFFPKDMWDGDESQPSKRQNLNHFCLSCPRSDWISLQERLEKAGIPIETGPAKRWGAHGTGVSIYFRDPENNLVEVRHYESENAGDPCLLGS